MNVGATIKIIGWLLMIGLPALISLFAAYVYVTSPGDRNSLVSYASIIVTVIVMSALPGLLVLLLGYAFSGPKREGSFGEPHS